MLEDMHLTHSMTPFSAVTSPDPYAYYAELVAQRPLYWDEGLQLWVAASARYVEAGFRCALAHVRPGAEPVPRTLTQSCLGEIFGNFARTNDGDRHDRLRETIDRQLNSWNDQAVAGATAECVDRLAAACDVVANSSHLNAFIERLPVFVMARLSGVDPALLPDIFKLVRDFALGIAPGAAPLAVSRGADVARALVKHFQTRTRDVDLAMTANAIGLLFQTYDATRGLIGNTLVALANHPATLEFVRGNPDKLGLVVEEAARYDPAAQNTRRYLSESLTIGNNAMRKGECMLLLIAAANRDQALNAAPDRFDPERAERKMFTFGLGSHACPGKSIALSIAGAAVRHLLASGLDIASAARRVSYEPSHSVRVPLF